MARRKPKADLTRRIPSDCLPQDVAEKASDDLILGNEAWGKLFRIRDCTPEQKALGLDGGPHYAALLEFLGGYVGTPYERKVWNRYFDYYRVQEQDLPTIDRAARHAGLKRWEYVAKVTLEELQRLARSDGFEAGAGKSNEAGAATAADDDTDDLLDEICDSLRSPDHRCIVRKLWNRKRPIKWEDLAQECGTSSNDSAVKKSLQRLARNLQPFDARGVYLDNNEGTKRVKLVHP